MNLRLNIPVGRGAFKGTFWWSLLQCSWACRRSLWRFLSLFSSCQSWISIYLKQFPQYPETGSKQALEIVRLQNWRAFNSIKWKRFLCRFWAAVHLAVTMPLEILLQKMIHCSQLEYSFTGPFSHLRKCQTKPHWTWYNASCDVESVLMKRIKSPGAYKVNYSCICVVRAATFGEF